VQSFWTKPQQLRWFMVSGIIAFLAGLYGLFYTHFSPIVIGFFAFGALVLLFYTFPLKYLGLGELFIFLIWGPIMIAGVYIVLALGQPNGNLSNIWNVVLAAVPYGLSVVSINIGKHIDKMKEDAKKGVGTLPVRIGQTAARYLNISVLFLMYLVVIYLVFVPRYFTPLMLIILLDIPRLVTAVKILSRPRPEASPPGYPIWPTYFSAFNFNHNRLFGGLFILALIGDTLLRLFLPSFWMLH
jgi:1,4-dihydroxy-2-naphthoate octaprenyltransferase